MERKMLMDESKVFDACALVEEIVKQLTSTSCPMVQLSRLWLKRQVKHHCY